MTPELDFAFSSHPVHRRDENAIGNRVRALDQFPCVALNLRDPPWLIGYPANGRRIKKNLRTGQRSRSCAFWKPLVPTDQRGDFCIARLKAGKAEIARRKVKLFIIERV